MEVIINEVHQVISLFEDEKAYNEEQERQLRKDVIKIYEQFVSSKDYFDYIAKERDRILINDKLQESYEAGIRQGEKEAYIEAKKWGNIEGKRDAKLNSVTIIIQEKYHVNELSWLNKCNEKQLNKVYKLMYKDISYEEFKGEILKDV